MIPKKIPLPGEYNFNQCPIALKIHDDSIQPTLLL
jgi:hypothetical protein